MTEELVDENIEGKIIIPLDSFVISIQQYDATLFNGTRITAFNTDNNDLSLCIDSDEEQCELPHIPKAVITLPPDIFDYASNYSSNAIISVVFVNDALFLRRNNLNKEVATVVLSASVAGADKIEGLNDSLVSLVFQRSKNPVGVPSQ